MKTAPMLLMAGMIALSPLALANQAGAVAPNFPSAAITKINYDGFHICKDMGASGYTAVARGILGDGGGGDRGASSRYFQVRTCFTTLAQCSRFIDRIHHRISKIDELRHASCSPRG